MKSTVFSHIGKRKINQDYVLVQNLSSGHYLFLVVDGMGGYEQGETAAKLVAENLNTYLSTVSDITVNEIQKGINKGNLALRQFKEREQIKTGATVGGVVLNASKAIAFWVGDVKIFYFKKSELVLESTPHTLFQEVISNGSIKDPDRMKKYKHVVTRSVQGDVKASQIETFIIDHFEETDLFIICSDGVHDLLDGIQIQHKLKDTKTVDEAIYQIENQLWIDAIDNFSLISIEKNPRITQGFSAK